MPERKIIMKTKIKLWELISLLILGSFSFIVNGCGSANPYYTSIEQYESGKWEEGWLFDGYSKEDMEELIQGMGNAEAKKTALEFFKKGYVFAPKNSDSSTRRIGTVAIINERTTTVKAGADWVSGNGEESIAEKLINEKMLGDGLLNFEWTVSKKSTVYKLLIPGKYKTWTSYKGKKIYKKESDGITDAITTIGLNPAGLNNEDVSAVILIQR